MITRVTYLLLLVLFSFSVYAQNEVENIHTLDNLKARQKKKKEPRPWNGHVAVKLGFGLYDFTSTYNNSSTLESREYSLPFPYAMASWEVAVRMGKEKDGFFAPANDVGFNYYRSNKGFFVDLEIGGSFYCGPGTANSEWECEPPSFYSYKSIQNGVVGAEKTVTLSDLSPETLLTTASENAQNAAGDDVSNDLIRAAGSKGSVATLFYFNNFFHLTPVNWLLNFGSSFSLFDTSLGPSLRIARYSDYGDPVKHQGNTNDNTIANVMLAARVYMHVPFTSDRLRLRGHFYYPFYSHLARVFNDKESNNEEYIINGGVDIALIKYLHLGFGYQWNFWRINPLSGDRVNQFRPGFEYQYRTSGFGYFELTIYVPFSGPKKE